MLLYITTKNTNFSTMSRLFILLLILTSNIITAQRFLNLDFEYATKGMDKPQNWSSRLGSYIVTLDSIEVSSGNMSLKIDGTNPIDGDFGVCTSYFPAEFVINKSIEFKGKIKTESLTNGYAGLWWRVDDKDNNILGFDNMSDRGLIGTNDWTEVSIKMDIPATTERIFFGGLFVGNGIAWFDDFQVWIDGEKFTDAEPKILKPTEERLAWLRKYIHPIQSFNPSFENIQDLETFGELIGDAKVVALGETTHGSSEIFQMKHRLIKYLNQHKGFDIFSIEANMPEAYKVNEYTLEGKGNPEDLIKGMYFWTWSTHEMLALVEWMKEQNKTDNKIQFTGFDMQYYQESINELKNGFAENSTLVKGIEELEFILNTVKKNAKGSVGITIQEPDKSRTEEIISAIKKSIEGWNENKTQKAWLSQNVRLVEQFLGKTYFSRDKFMAENLEWINEQNPDSKIAIWAHNGHIKKVGNSMGKILAQSLKEDYLSVGFTFHKGSYTAVGKKGLNTYEAQESFEGTYEYLFQALDEPIFLLDLRQIKEDNSEHGKWLRENLEFRSVGAAKVDNEFKTTILKDDFDIIIFINESTNSKLLR